MNVECSSCHSKYAVLDEKVIGRKVRIRCKRCHKPIVVDARGVSAPPSSSEQVLPESQVGPAAANRAAHSKTLIGLTHEYSALPSQVSLETASATRATTEVAARAEPDSLQTTVDPALTGPDGAQTDEPLWFVALAEDEQPSMSTAQVVATYRAGLIDEDTYIWREGLGDWTALEDVPELAQAIIGGVSRAQAVADALPANLRPAESAQEAPATERDTSAQTASSQTVSSQTGAPQANASTPAAAPTTTNPWTAAQSPQKSSSRTALTFSRSSSASSRSSRNPAAAPVQHIQVRGVSASTGVGGAAEASPAPADSGWRNESSMLFSLNALVGPGASSAPAPSQSRASQEEALLLQLPSAVSYLPPPPDASIFTESAPEPVESNATTAPPMVATAHPPSSQKYAVPLVPAALALLATVVAAVGVTWGISKDQALETLKTETQEQGTDSVKTAEMQLTKQEIRQGAQGSAPDDPLVAAGSMVTPPPDEKQASRAKTLGTGPSTSGAQATQSSPAGTARPPTPAAGKAPVGDRPAAAAAAAKADATTTTAAEEAAPAAAGGGAAFNTAAARQALEGAASTSTSTCKRPDGPKGTGRVEVTFNPSGRTTRTVVGGDFAGSIVGGCIAKVFRSVRVPSFEGEPVKVSKTVTIK